MAPSCDTSPPDPWSSLGRRCFQFWSDSSLAPDLPSSADRLDENATRQQSRVAFLKQTYTRVLPQFHSNLSVARVHRDHPRSAMLEQAIRKAARRSANV